ncbi:FkbM family methyltransferase [Humitalea rosea]|uniref:FkbM family methyltransferase n=1 Tax=Humitalea rosea TaxID=990373 RepID=A0A2W7KGC4_9PROT|nr:FkbM family methyltransferase [Humitalea rosea]PZW46779.1 FkbM family methyltransferase [Humitalea rosea]
MTAITQSRAEGFALRTACAGLRLYFQHAPGRRGKAWVWDRIVRRYITWRSFNIEARTRFGARLEGGFPDSVHSYVYFFGVWEPAITALYRAALRPGDVVIDIGANVGLHTLLASRLVGPTGHVHAVEASPWIFQRLQRNLATNGAANVQPYNMAATATAGPVPVYLHDESNLGGTTIVAAEAAKTGTLQEAVVEGRPLPDIVPLVEITAARLIKIDVEGAEWLVVQGMRDVLPLLRPDVEILVEVNQSALEGLGGSLDAFLAIFAEAGFSAFEVANAYQGGFYIQPPPSRLVPLQRRDFEMADLVFRRTAAKG